MISAAGLTKAYSPETGIFAVDLDVARGTVTALLGPNGAGKTTVVRVLTTLVKPDAGEVRVGGLDAVRQPEKVRSIIGTAGQAASVDDKLTGLQNLTLFGRLQRLSRQQACSRAAELLEQFGLANASKRPVKSYSGGMRRKLDLAASLIVGPAVLFLDEPTAGLDPLSRAALWDIISGLVRAGSTVLLTTQYLDEADRLADQIVLINKGRVVATGSPGTLKARAGRARLELTTRTDAGFRRLRGALNGREAIAAGPRTLTVPLEGPGPGGWRQLHEVLRTVSSSGAEVESYHLHEASLEDVFVQLTGPGAAGTGTKAARPCP